jgi:hypothetical protein
LLCRVAEVVVSPSFVFLQQAKVLLRSDFSVVAQNCWVRKGGAVTGEIRLVLPLVLMLCIRLVPVAPAQEALLPAPWALLAT